MRKGGEPLIREGVDLGDAAARRAFVLGRTIDEALARARAGEPDGYTFSFDMLGEAALTERRQRYRAAYAAAIARDRPRATRACVRAGPVCRSSSRRCTRATSVQRDARDARTGAAAGRSRARARYDIGFTIDAEEADRLDLSLDVIEACAPIHAPQPGTGSASSCRRIQKRAGT